MIFISHTRADKPVVQPIAERLAAVFGQDKVFYDSWSIQPGDGIVEQMNRGLEQCRFFFFFVSKNSLRSERVKLEWQNAILKATQGETRFIPVKLDDVLPGYHRAATQPVRYRNARAAEGHVLGEGPAHSEDRTAAGARLRVHRPLRRLPERDHQGDPRPLCRFGAVRGGAAEGPGLRRAAVFRQGRWT